MMKLEPPQPDDLLWIECKISAIGSCVWTLGPQLVIVWEGCGTFRRWSLARSGALDLALEELTLFFTFCFLITDTL